MVRALDIAKPRSPQVMVNGDTSTTNAVLGLSSGAASNPIGFVGSLA